MGRWEPIELGPESILLVDDDLVAVDKAAGVLCDASRDPNRDHLGTALQRWAAEHLDASPDAAFLPAHRLDLGTSGVVLFARHKDAATAFMKQFQDRTVNKHYQAVVELPANADWGVGTTFERSSYLRHHKGRSEEVRSGGKPSSSHFEVLAIDGALALVRASPQTGRTHQLRVHLAAVGAAIVGDDLYGHGSAGRLWLHSHHLSLAHPSSGEQLTIRSRQTLQIVGGRPFETHTSKPSP